MEQAVCEAVGYFNRLGFTAFKEPMAFEEELRTYQAADRRDQLTLHMAAHIVHSSPLGGETVPHDRMDQLRLRYASDNVRLDFAKLFLDGVAPGYTASFIEPYLAESGYDTSSYNPDSILLILPAALNEMLIELDRRGYTVKMHAVGDNAIRKGLDAIEAARTANGQSGLRHEIAHSNYVSDADLLRFRGAGAVAELSPKMWYPNPGTPVQIALLGRERVQKNHRIADLLKAGAKMTYGSDWPAAAPDANPWTGLWGHANPPQHRSCLSRCTGIGASHLTFRGATDLHHKRRALVENGAGDRIVDGGKVGGFRDPEGASHGHPARRHRRYPPASDHLERSGCPHGLNPDLWLVLLTRDELCEVRLRLDLAGDGEVFVEHQQ